MRTKLVLLLAVLSLAACATKNIQTKEAAKEAVVNHLGKVSGLDVSKMDVEITQMSFQETTADVGVSVSPKGMPATEGMQMAYQLKREGDKWVVAGKKGGSGGGHGGGMAPPPAGGGGGGDAVIPPGHPPLGEGAKK